MSLFEYYNRKIPVYYPTMFLDGYSPQQIWDAKRREIFDGLAERDQTDKIHITTEVKLK